MTVQEKTIRKKLNTLGFNGAEPEAMSLSSPPSSCRTLDTTLVPKCIEQRVTHLLKDETIPERMGIDAGGFEPFELSVDCPPE